MPGRMPMWRRYLTFWGRDVDRDLRDEVDFHLEARTRELVGQGWSPEAARQEAQRTFGEVGPIVNACRHIDRRVEQQRRATRCLADLKDDVRFALRQIRRQPRYWGVIVLTLVVGIAASTSLFAVVDGVLLKPLPYPDAGRLVRVMSWNYRGEYVAVDELARSVDVAAYYPTTREVTVNAGDRPARLGAAGVTADLFDVLGVRPALGRSFTPAETRPGGPGIVGASFWRTYGVVIVSAGVWRDYFGASPTVVGSTLLVERVPHTVVGVMPPGFHFPSRDTALWFPHNLDPDPGELWAGNVAAMIGRLRDGHDAAGARAEVRALASTIQGRIPWGGTLDTYGNDLDVRPLADEIVGEARPMLLLLLVAIGLVLLVICVNVANLLLARGVARDREMTTRAALGAGRIRLARQMLVETLTVALLAGLLAVLASQAVIGVLVALLPADLPRLEQVRLDARVLLFAFGATTLTGLAFGLLPAIRATRAGRGLSPRGTAGLAVGAREGRLAGGLAALEFSLAVVLVVSAVLLLQSFRNLTAVDPGFRADRLVTARVSPPGLAELAPATRHLFVRNLLDGLAAVRGVRSAAAANAIPFDPGLHGTVFRIEGRPPVGEGGNAGATYLGVTRDYFATMETPVVEGRRFAATDGVDSPRVAVVSRRAAALYWDGESPIGSRIQFQHYGQYLIDAEGNLPWFTVVGVVGDVRFAALADDAPPMVYLPLDQFWSLTTLRVIARTTDGAPPIAPELRRIVATLDPSTPVTDVTRYDSRLADTIARPRFVAWLLGGFAVVAMFLAAIGAYGVLSHAMSRRIPEIGVRLAFGASGRHVFGLLFGHGLRITLAGILVGLPLALASTRLLSALLFGVDPVDPVVFGGVAGVLLLVGLGVSYVPAHRATKVNPILALRAE